MSVLVKSVYRWFKPIWELHWISVINKNPSFVPDAFDYLLVFYTTVYSFCIWRKQIVFRWILLFYTICDLFSFSPSFFGFALPVFLLFEGSSPSPRFLSRPSNLFLPLQDKCLVRALCFPSSPSQRIYDVPAVWAISQGHGIHCRSRLGWTVIPGVHC